MPAKSMCPDCGQGRRSPAHICMPTDIEKIQRRRAAVKNAATD